MTSLLGAPICGLIRGVHLRPYWLDSALSSVLSDFTFIVWCLGLMDRCILHWSLSTIHFLTHLFHKCWGKTSWTLLVTSSNLYTDKEIALISAINQFLVERWAERHWYWLNISRTVCWAMSFIFLIFYWDSK